MRRLAALALAAPPLVGCATVPPAPLPDRSLDAFEAALAAQDSATAALTDWCALHRIAEPARITARPADEAVDMVRSSEARSALAVTEGEPLAYRHVLLSCGDVVLSDAHNWYVPARLTPEANRLLVQTDTPFGRAVGPENFTRTRKEQVADALVHCPFGTVLAHRAILHRSDGLPISMVVECYTPANLADE